MLTSSSSKSYGIKRCDWRQNVSCDQKFCWDLLGSGIGKAGELMASDGWEAPALPQTYVPGPVDVGWEIWVGFAAGLIPFMIGSWEFGKRIVSCPPPPLAFLRQIGAPFLFNFQKCTVSEKSTLEVTVGRCCICS